jgi:head-tail adaptor
MAPIDVWSIRANEVKCRLVRSKAIQGDSIAEIGEREAITSEYRLAVMIETDVNSDDRIIFHGETFDVVHVDDSLTDKFFKHVIIKRRRGVS